MKPFHSLLQMIDTLHTEEDCREYLEDMRWHGEPVCPHCGSISKHHYKLTQKGEFKGLYKCKDCRERFTVRIGTMFEDSNLPLKKWFYAIFLFLSHKKGISSAQLARDIHVTQKTPWFMLQRIRQNIKDDDATFDDMTQMDETYMGGKTSDKHKRRKKYNASKTGKKDMGRSVETKAPIFGMISDGKAYAQVVPNAQKETLLPIINERVRKGSTIITDGLSSYDELSKNYIHKIVLHSKQIYCVNGFHTNSIEGFWSLIKRGILGIYHMVSKKHLPKYCKEFVFRYNTRSMSDGERFNLFLQQPTERLYYGELLMKPEWIW